MSDYSKRDRTNSARPKSKADELLGGLRGADSGYDAYTPASGEGSGAAGLAASVMKDPRKLIAAVSALVVAIVAGAFLGGLFGGGSDPEDPDLAGPIVNAPPETPKTPTLTNSAPPARPGEPETKGSAKVSYGGSSVTWPKPRHKGGWEGLPDQIDAEARTSAVQKALDALIPAENRGRPAAFEAWAPVGSQEITGFEGSAEWKDGSSLGHLQVYLVTGSWDRPIDLCGKWPGDGGLGPNNGSQLPTTAHGTLKDCLVKGDMVYASAEEDGRVYRQVFTVRKSGEAVAVGILPVSMQNGVDNLKTIPTYELLAGIASKLAWPA